MSSQRGNVNRTRAQKHQNGRVFKNDLHDTNIRTKRINQVQIVNVCAKCKAILEWKIKYKKYKLLTTPRRCNKCNEKTVKQPYHTVCNECAHCSRICPKCECPMSTKHDNQRDIPTENEQESRVEEVSHTLSDLLLETKLEGCEFPSSEDVITSSESEDDDSDDDLNKLEEMSKKITDSY